MIRNGGQLHDLLSNLAGRELSKGEVREAFGETYSTYYRLLKRGELLTADRLITAAHHLGINPIELLVTALPGITARDAMEFLDKKVAELRELMGTDDVTPLVAAASVAATQATMTTSLPTTMHRRARKKNSPHL